MPSHIFSTMVLSCLALGGVTAAVNAEDAPEVPLGLTAPRIPQESPFSTERAALGQQLFFDTRLSRDSTISCASCHDPQQGYSNGAQFATGVDGQLGGRNSPTIINSALGYFQFWDGRAGSLEEQALGPIQNPIEMNMTLDEVVDRLNKIEGYRQKFQDIFGSDVTSEAIAMSIASFERTILSGNTPYDRFKAGDETALSEEAQRGMKLFFGKAHCSACHSGPNFTDNGFHNIGVGMELEKPDQGRSIVTGLKGDIGSFKTPTVREIAKTAPYMHDGSQKTLEEVVQHYVKGGTPNPYLDEEIFELKLSEAEQKDLIRFMVEGLSSPDYPEFEAPPLPESE